MKTICVNREVLLKIVSQNYEAHKAEVAEAKVVYQQKLEQYAENFCGYINERRRTGELACNDLFTGHRHGVGLVPSGPDDHCDDYRRVIDQLNLCCEDEVVLEANEFDSFARDEWSWTGEYRSTNSAYSSSLRSKMSKH